MTPEDLCVLSKATEKLWLELVAEELVPSSIPPGTTVYVGQQPATSAGAGEGGELWAAHSGDRPHVTGKLRTAAGPSLGELAHQQPCEQSPSPARTPAWAGALQRRTSGAPETQ